ncbi:MAG TPA: hypothetical protein VK112_07855 [Fodinibius sp.]|nr:hypothetical protein [Fodinibius sp.]
MKILGYIVSVAGLIGLIYTVINYINNTESFSALGIDVTVSEGDPIPMIISAIVLIAGLLITRAAKE